MSTRNRWLAGLLGLAAVAGAWGALRDRGAGLAEPDVGQPPPLAETAARTNDVPAPSRRTELLAPQAGTPPASEPSSIAPDQPPPEPRSRSPLAWNLEHVADSFLTQAPRVEELFELAGRLAGQAVVPPEGLSVQRHPDGALLSARGTLNIADIEGTFLIDADGYHVEFTSTDGDASWSRRTIQITFEADEAGPRGCHAIVQFEPKSPAAGEDAASGERLVGWSLGTSRESGTWARPMTLSPDGDGWQIADSERVQSQEFPGLSGTAVFDSWWELLKPIAAR